MKTEEKKPEEKGCKKLDKEVLKAKIAEKEKLVSDKKIVNK